MARIFLVKGRHEEKDREISDQIVIKSMNYMDSVDPVSNLVPFLQRLNRLGHLPPGSMSDPEIVLGDCSARHAFVLGMLW